MRFHPRSMRAFARLYAVYNDIDIYVEDRRLVGMYERVFGRLLGRGVRITAVVPMDGKANLIAEARRLSSDNQRRRFFLLDGDFDWILNRRVHVKSVYMMKCYSIENLTWDRELLIDIASQMCPGSSTSSVSAILLQEWFDSTVRSLTPLFVYYAVCSALNAECQTVGFSVIRLGKRRPHFEVDSNLIMRRLRSIVRYLRTSHSMNVIIAARQKVERSFDSVDRSKVISGKDYLWPLLHARFVDRLSYRGSREQLLSLALHHASFNLEPGLQRSLRRCAKGDHALRQRLPSAERDKRSVHGAAKAHCDHLRYPPRRCTHARA